VAKNSAGIIAPFLPKLRLGRWRVAGSKAGERKTTKRYAINSSRLPIFRPANFTLSVDDPRDTAFELPKDR
jgi:hypothetical protein